MGVGNELAEFRHLEISYRLGIPILGVYQITMTLPSHSKAKRKNRDQRIKYHKFFLRIP
jgi:hypothetical protein